jgi:hypothetical protein
MIISKQSILNDKTLTKPQKDLAILYYHATIIAFLNGVWIGELNGKQLIQRFRLN